MSQPDVERLLQALARDEALKGVKKISALNLKFGVEALRAGIGGTLVIQLPRGNGAAEIEYHGGSSPERTVALTQG